MEKFFDSLEQTLLNQWLREGRGRTSCSFCGVIVFIEKEGVKLLNFHKWFSCIKAGLNDGVNFAELYNDVSFLLSRARLRAFSTIHRPLV